MRVEKRGQGRGEMVSTAVTFFSRNPSQSKFNFSHFKNKLA